MRTIVVVGLLVLVGALGSGCKKSQKDRCQIGRDKFVEGLKGAMKGKEALVSDVPQRIARSGEKFTAWCNALTGQDLDCYDQMLRANRIEDIPGSCTYLKDQFMGLMTSALLESPSAPSPP